MWWKLKLSYAADAKMQQPFCITLLKHKEQFRLLENAKLTCKGMFASTMVQNSKVEP